MQLTPGTPSLTSTAILPLLARELQPGDEAIWAEERVDGKAGRATAHVEYLIIPPDEHEVVLVDTDDRHYPLVPDQPVVAIRGEEWRTWLGCR